MVKNLLNTGTVFDYSADDQSFVDDILNLDLNVPTEPNGPVETSADKSFEEED